MQPAPPFQLWVEREAVLLFSSKSVIIPTVEKAEMEEREGQVKIIADKRTDRILGAHILGPRASDLIAELATAMELGASAEDLARSVHAHPTLPEAVKEAALAVAGRAIHI